MKDPKKVNADSFVIEMETKPVSLDEKVKHQMAKSKGVWFAALNINPARN